MTDTSRYMGILAKVMQNTKISKNKLANHIDEYNELYYLIYSKLNDKLKKSLFPYASEILRKTDNMLNSMESLFIFPEVLEKKSLLVSCYTTTNVFEIFKSLFVYKDFISSFNRVYTQIPIVIVNTDDDNRVEIINFANVRIPLSFKELKFLIIESGRRKIALNKIIKFIIVKTKLVEEDLCIISDNIYSDAETIFWRTVSKSIAYIDDRGLKSIEKRKLNKYSALLMSNDTLLKMSESLNLKEYRCISFNEMKDYVKNEVHLVVYGFLDEFISVETQIMEYYESQLYSTKSMLDEVIRDITFLGDSKNEILQSIRKSKESYKNKLVEEYDDISEILKEIEKLLTEICNAFKEDTISGKTVPRHVINYVFESFFRSLKLGDDIRKKQVSRLYTCEYDNMELVIAYIRKLSNEEIRYKLVEIKKNEWEKAKMIIAVLGPDKISNHELRKYMDVLGDYCSTGEELYLKSKLSSGKKRIELLQESLNNGYEKAGIELLEMYNKNNSNVNLFSLANALIPEACMILAEEKMSRYRYNKQFVDLTDREFAYYKIASTKKYLPAIAKIVDIVFESRFSTGFQIPTHEVSRNNERKQILEISGLSRNNFFANIVNDNKYDEMISNGSIIEQLCRFLISKMYMVQHYSEVLGVVLFSLNKNCSEAMTLLSNAKSSLAYYCKGNMYENGNGVAINLDEAISNYKKSIAIDSFEKSKDRLSDCIKRKQQDEKKNKSSNYYQEDRSYYSSYEYKSSKIEDDGCFTPKTRILMSDGSFTPVEDIKIGDRVIVFNHYKAKLETEEIIANVHDNSNKRIFDIITLIFEDGKKLEIVKSHVLFDMTENRYVWLDDENVGLYIGHDFAMFENERIVKNRLIDYFVESKETSFYAPISRFHLNVFAENILTMPPTKLTLNIFDIGEDMIYELPDGENTIITPYKDISDIVTVEEYENLPCKYLSAVLSENNCTMEDFKYAIMLYREHRK